MGGFEFMDLGHDFFLKKFELEEHKCKVIDEGYGCCWITIYLFDLRPLSLRCLLQESTRQWSGFDFPASTWPTMNRKLFVH